MKLAIYRAIKCGTEYNARNLSTIAGFVIMIKTRHRLCACRLTSLREVVKRQAYAYSALALPLGNRVACIR